MELTYYIVDDENHCITLITDHFEGTHLFKIFGTTTDPRKALTEIKQLKPRLLQLNQELVRGGTCMRER